MKNFKRILCAVLCFAMIVPMFVIAPSAEAESGTTFIDEDFEKVPIGSLPDGWTTNSGAGLTSTVESSTIEIKDDVVEEPKAVNKALNVSHLFGGSAAINAVHDFGRSATATISFDYQMASITAPTTSRPNGGSNGVTFFSYDDSYTNANNTYYRIAVLYVSENVGRFAYMDSSNKYHDILDSNGNAVEVQKGEWYHVELSVDSSHTDKTVVSYKIQYGENLLAQGSFNHTKLGDPNRVSFHCMANSETNDSFFVDNVKIVAGSHTYTDDFEDTAIDSTPTGFVKTGAGEVKVVEREFEPIPKVNHALNVSHLAKDGTAITAKHDFTRSSTATVTFDYQMQSLTAPISESRPNGGSNGVTFYCYDDSYTTDQKAYYRIAVLYVSETLGRLTYMDSSNKYHNILDYDGNPVYIEKGEWYHFEISVDSSAASGTTIKYKVDHYGKTLAEGSIAHTKSNDPNRLVFHCMATNEKNDSFFVDNVYLKAGDHVYTSDFESDSVDSAPTGIDKLGEGTVKVVERELSNNKALYVTHLTGAGTTSVVKNSFATTQYATVSFDYQMESMCYATTTGTHSVSFWYSSTNYYRLAVRRVSDDKGKLVVHDGNNYIDVTDSNGNVVEIERGAVYHFEVACDTSPTDHTLLTYKVSKNGKIIAEGSIKNTRWKNDINYITIQTTGSDHFNDAFYIDNLVINNGTSTLSENFEEISLETVKPTVSGITYEGGASNSSSFKVVSLPIKKIEVEQEKEYYTTKALYITDTTTASGPIITYKTFSGVDTLTAEFDYMLATEESYAANGFALGGGGTGTYDLRVLLKVFPNGDGTSTLKYYNGSSWISSTATKIVPFKWYSVKIEAIQGESTVAVYINGVKVCDAWARPTVERMDRVIFQSHNAAGTGDKFYIDNLKVTTPTVFGDEPVTFEDDFSGANLPDGYSFSGNGTNSFGGGVLTLNGAMRAVRDTSYTKSGKFSFSVKTDNVDGLYFGLSVDNTDVYMIKSDNLGRLFYQRDKVDVAINTRELIKANEWVNIAIDLPYDRNAPYAYLYVDGEMRGHILYNALSDYVNGIFIGAEAGTTVSVKDVKCELSDGVIKIPEREESDPVIYLPEVVGGQVLYLANDKSPKTSTLAPVGDGTITVDKKYTSIGFDAGNVQQINSIRITTSNAEEFKVNYRYFSLYTSNDNKSWQSFGKVTYNHFLEDGKWTMLFEFSGVEARYVKLNFTSDTCLDVRVENPAENIRAERRIDRQWKMAGQNMTAIGDTAPMFTPMIRLFVEDEGVEIKTGDSVGLNFGLASPVEAVELVANGLSSIEGDAFEVYTSNDNCEYDKIEQVIISRDERDGKDVLRFTFDSVECTYIKLYVKGEGISLSLDSLTDGFCAYSSVEASSFEVNGVWPTRGGEGDFYTLSDGTIVMTYIGYGASGQGDFVDNDILAKMSTDGGKTWSKPWLMLSKQLASDDQLESVNIMQTRLFWLENDELGILYHEKNGEENRSNLYFRRSYDLGRNWEDPIQITEIYDPYYSLMSSGNCVNRLPNGRILFATTTNEYINDVWGTPHVKVYIWYSDDEGYTWERSDGAIVLPNTACESCIAPLENGDLLITMRTRKEAKIYQSISTDGGNTWAQPEAVEGLVTPSSTNTIVTIPATGDVLLIWNDEYATDNGNRNPLTFAVSSDNGLTYKNKKNTIEAGASWPVMTFYGRRAYMQPSSGVKVCDVEELYYTKYGAKTLADLPKAATPAATYDSGWLKGVSSTMKYSLDGGATWRFCGGASVQIGEGHEEILVKDIGTHEYSPSNVQVIGGGAQPLATDTASVLYNGRLVLDTSHAMYNKTKTLEFDVEDLGDGEVTVAHGEVFGDSRVTTASQLVLTKDKLISYTFRGELPPTLDVCHGLDISGRVKVTVNATYDKATVTLETENGKYTSKEFIWLGSNGDIYAESKGVALDNVRFSWDCSDLAKDIWFMGDSMFDSSGLVIPTAWPYFAVEAGYTDACWFGFGGRKTEQALEDFKRALKYDSPEYAVWCMGGNNQDSASTVNSAWKKATDEFLAICNEKGIIPILATIPNSQNRINYYKNQIVKNSGYRYIDLSAAVGANDTPATSDWYEGYRYTDGLHPSALGAQAMFEQVIKDLPEFNADQKG